MDPAQIEKIAGLISIVLPEVIGLATMLIALIRSADMPEQTKEQLIARIRAAQAGVPEWK